jgi:hypothetical protein
MAHYVRLVQYSVGSVVNLKKIVFFYVLLTVHLDIIVSRKINLMHNLFFEYFVNLYMFRA